ncbi:MAG: DUF2171 domain-containing protein [Nitrososphaerales archaeon]
MKQIQPWTNEDMMKKEVKSCDNHDMGEVKEIDVDLIFTEKGSKHYQIPRDSIGTFDGDKVWLRATEAEVIAGVYPFIQDERKRNEQNLDTLSPPNTP